MITVHVTIHTGTVSWDIVVLFSRDTDGYEHFFSIRNRLRHFPPRDRGAQSVFPHDLPLADQVPLALKSVVALF